MPPLPRSAVIWKRPIVLPVSSSLPARTVGSFAGSSTIALLICVARILRAVVFVGVLKNAEKICRWKLWYLIGLFCERGRRHAKHGHHWIRPCGADRGCLRGS